MSAASDYDIPFATKETERQIFNIEQYDNSANVTQNNLILLMLM